MLDQVPTDSQAMLDKGWKVSGMSFGSLILKVSLVLPWCELNQST